MFTYTVNFKNIEGQPASRTLYFNLSMDEMTRLELKYRKGGGPGFLQALDDYRKAEDHLKAYEAIFDLVDMGYGEKDPDDLESFDKSPEAKAKFKKNLARTAIVDQLLTDRRLFASFMQKVFPEGMVSLTDEEVEKALAEAEAEERRLLEEQAAKVAPAGIPPELINRQADTSNQAEPTPTGE